MLDGNDKKTFYALKTLRDVVDKKQKPIIIWVGAGASKWCGYPTWQETCQQFLKSFRRFEHRFEKAEAERLFHEEKFPELFELLRKTNVTRYNREMVSVFGPRAVTPVYGRFLNEVRAISPIKIVTTNVDETLERNLMAGIVQRSDLENCLNLLGPGQTFIAKLHGSISSVETTVFTATDYEKLLADPSYLKVLQLLFAQTTVVFVGYSLRDKYVLDLFTGACGVRRLFGDGPHFLVHTGEAPALPESIETVRYSLDPYVDHRSAITVLDIVRVAREGGHIWFAPENESPPEEHKLKSAYFISDIFPPGVWTSSFSLELAGPGQAFNAIIGQGFDDSELPEKTSPAMHDLTVGLVSFDVLNLPLSCAGRVHDLIGSAMFWDMVKAGVFRFISFERQPMLAFKSLDEVQGGDIAETYASGEGGKPQTVEELIRAIFKPAAGKEAEAEKLFELLKTYVFTFDHARFNIPNLTRGALLHPAVQRLLGLSDAVLPTSLPRWVRFPVLRLAHTIMSGCACESFAVPATKIGFGGEILVGATFAVSAARDWADSVSSYVLTSRFNTDLGHYVQSNPSVLAAMLKFRDTQAGIDLRREILQELATNSGSEFVAAVNGGLRHILPSHVMDTARDQLSGLLFRKDPESPVVPAVWTNERNPDSIAKLWRRRSRRELEQYCRTRGIKEGSLCPCGSGEKLRLCCAQALRD